MRDATGVKRYFSARVRLLSAVISNLAQIIARPDFRGRLVILPFHTRTMTPPAFEQKICPPAKLNEHITQLARPLVFTNGCFDILHRGHVTYLARARALGNALVVALNTDASVRRLGKGDERPVNTLEDRLAIIAALECVDLVTWFDEETPIARILEIRPNVLVKGGDWAPADMIGAPEVSGWGGSVHSIPFEHERSTTALLTKIRG